MSFLTLFVLDQLSATERERLNAVYLELQRESPKATAPVRIPLDFLEGTLSGSQLRLLILHTVLCR